MKLKSLGANQTELTLNDGSQILFSYETPVCVRTEAMHCGQMQTRVCVTAEKYSRTTTGHINKWLRDNVVPGTPAFRVATGRSRARGLWDIQVTVPQSEIDNFVKGTTI
jgi:hypothetical protein|tara:strand:+ start:383 stop:709 length:327 start_codon:yes stop_codon:yes gene_type:complete